MITRDVGMLLRVSGATPLVAPPALARSSPATTAPLLSLTAARAPRYRARLLLQQRDEDDDEGDDDEYLEEIERVLTDPDSVPTADQSLRVQNFLRRRRDGPDRRGPPPPRGELRRYTRESTQLFRLPSTLASAYNDFLEKPGQPLLLGSLSLLVGFYLAGALSTIFGAAGFWEPTIALGPLTVTELITRRYYSRPASERSQTIRLLNALKVGFYLGIVIDALKLAG